MQFRGFTVAVAVLATLGFGGLAPAQQVATTAPFHAAGDSFFEHSGVSFAGNWRGMSFAVGGPSQAVPPFGPFVPQSGLNTNFAIAGPHGQGNFGFDFSQGSTRNLVSQSPMVTTLNGYPGFVSDASWTPYVIGVVPVVGGFSMVQGISPLPSPARLAEVSGVPVAATNPRVQAMLQQGPGAVEKKPASPDLVERPARPADPMARARESSAGHAAPSVAEARRMHEAEQATAEAEIRTAFDRAQAADQAGKPNVAKVYYRMVARRASGELQQQALARLHTLRQETAAEKTSAKK